MPMIQHSVVQVPRYQIMQCLARLYQSTRLPVDLDPGKDPSCLEFLFLTNQSGPSSRLVGRSVFQSASGLCPAAIEPAIKSFDRWSHYLNCAGARESGSGASRSAAGSIEADIPVAMPAQHIKPALTLKHTFEGSVAVHVVISAWHGDLSNLARGW